MAQFITDVTVIATESAFFRDDQQAIRAGAARNGFLYDGAPQTVGFHQIREPGKCLTVLLRLEDGTSVTGDCVEVQYAGAGGREAPLSFGDGEALIRERVAPALIGSPISSFRDETQLLAGLELPVWLGYGVSQALLRAAAASRRGSMTQVICDEWALPLPSSPVPVFAQSGDAPLEAIDRMILKRVDALPHGLINSVETRLGRRGELLEGLVRAVRDRILALRRDDDYAPTLQFDVYGTIGIAFPTIPAMVDYIAKLETAAAPFRLRIEHPLDAGDRKTQIERLGALRAALRAHGCSVGLIADEWCNTLEDIELFAASGCVDMVQVKTPDLGAVDAAITAMVRCREHGVQVYCGGSCNETLGSAQVTAHLALACGADLILAKPGMGVDEGLSVVRNEMAVALAELQLSARADVP